MHTLQKSHNSLQVVKLRVCQPDHIISFRPCPAGQLSLQGQHAVNVRASFPFVGFFHNVNLIKMDLAVHAIHVLFH